MLYLLDLPPPPPHPPSPQHCKFKVQENTLFFMPHCGKAMYNNLLWANWSVDRLGKMVIIGNSFNSYHEKYSAMGGIIRTSFQAMATSGWSSTGFFKAVLKIPH